MKSNKVVTIEINQAAFPTQFVSDEKRPLKSTAFKSGKLYNMSGLEKTLVSADIIVSGEIFTD